MERKADTEPFFGRRVRALATGASGLVAATILLAVYPADAKFRYPKKEPARPVITLPIEFPGAQYEPLAWSSVPGWIEDDHLAALKAFRTSCAPILAQRSMPQDIKPLGISLREPCNAAKTANPDDSTNARAFFEQHFVPLRISRLGEEAGFVTGYYEPVVDGSRTQSDAFPVPVYRRPSNLFVRGFSQASASMPNKGQVFRKIGRRKLVPYYDRAEIEDGAIAGRGLEVVWLKSQTDLLFIQIQGSARIRLEDGPTVRINYDAHNGYPYTPVGRVLIERNIVPKAEMSMQRIREYMDHNVDAAAELRRQNKSYVFFREVSLSDKDEAVGAQGVQLLAGRSIAVDKSMHVYGTPFFIDSDLPIDSDKSNNAFRRLMVAQDTGSAIVGPARADIYFGAGKEAGQVAGRIKNAARFALLLPKSLDPVERAKTVLLPADRPSAEIARLFPPADVAPKETAKEPSTDQVGKAPTPAAKPAAEPADVKPPAVAALAIPLPEPRPASASAIPLPVARPDAAPKAQLTSAKPLRQRTRSRSYRWFR